MAAAMLSPENTQGTGGESGGGEYFKGVDVCIQID